MKTKLTDLKKGEKVSGNWFLYCTWENVWKDIEALKTDKGSNHEHIMFSKECAPSPQ